VIKKKGAKRKGKASKDTESRANNGKEGKNTKGDPRKKRGTKNKRRGGIRLKSSEREVRKNVVWCVRKGRGTKTRISSIKYYKRKKQKVSFVAHTPKQGRSQGGPEDEGKELAKVEDGQIARTCKIQVSEGRSLKTPTRKNQRGLKVMAKDGRVWTQKGQGCRVGVAQLSVETVKKKGCEWEPAAKRVIKGNLLKFGHENQENLPRKKRKKPMKCMRLTCTRSRRGAKSPGK